MGILAGSLAIADIEMGADMVATRHMDSPGRTPLQWVDVAVEYHKARGTDVPQWVWDLLKDYERACNLMRPSE